MASLWSYWRRNGLPKQKFDTVGGMMSYATELSKRAPTASLTSQGADTGTLRIDLSWRMHGSDLTNSARRPSPWRRPLELFKPAEIQTHTQGLASVDFDLACLYELTDGSKGVIQPLGGLLGDFSEPPYVKLSGDDRFGTASGETLYVNLDHREQIKRLLIFVYIYDGVPAFDRADVVVTLVTSDGKNIEIGLNDPAPQARSCAVAMIEHHKGELVARREVKYVYGFQSEIDRLYGWGMSWGRGFKEGRARA
jgi:uncharacterized protein involved in tellurium resistance